MHKLTEKYSWIEDQDIVLTLAIVTGSSEGRVVDVYGGEPGNSQGMTFAEAEDMGLEHYGDDFYVQVFSSGEHVVVLENNGWSGTVPEISRRASRGGTFLSVSWNVNGVFRVLRAERGTVTAWFDPLHQGKPAGPADIVPGWVQGADFVVGQLRAACLAAVEQQSGVVFEQAWLSTTLPTYRIPDPDVLLRGVEGARVP